MQIAHRGRYIIMQHHLLNRQQITAILNHERGGSVPEKDISTVRPHDACFLSVIKGTINQGKPHEIKQYYQFLEREGDNHEGNQSRSGS
jgi:hypothetical protein